MVMANTERVAKALDLLRDGLGPACEATWWGFYGDGWLHQVNLRPVPLHAPPRQPRRPVQRHREPRLDHHLA